VKQPHTNRILLAAAAALVAIAAALALGGALGFVASGEWLAFVRGRWAAVWAPLALFLVFVTLALALIRDPEGPGRRARAAGLSGLVLTAFLLHVSMANLAPEGPKETVYALVPPKTQFYYLTALHHPDVEEVIGEYDAVVGRMEAELFRGRLRDPRNRCWSLRTHPPGPVVFYRVLIDLYDGVPALRRGVVSLADGLHFSGERATVDEFQPSTVGVTLAPWSIDTARCVVLTMQLLACLAVVPVYLLGSELHSRRTGFVAAAFAALLPGVHCFSPGFDQTYPLCAALLAWLAVMAVSRRSTTAAACLGLLLCVALLFSMAFLVPLGLIGAVLVVELLGRAKREGLATSLRPHWGSCAAAAAGFAALVAAFALTWEVNLFSTWLRCVRENADFNAAAARPYWASLVSNPVEFLVFLGLPLACLFALAVGRSVREARRERVPAVAVLCFVGLMLALTFSGANRGEVARLWMFAMPFCAVAGAWWLEKRSVPAWMFAALLVLQFAQMVCFRAGIDAFSLPR